jgi:hypothetical protein
LKVARAAGRGFSITHRGWPVMAVVFVFYAIIRFFAVPNDDIPPYIKSIGDWGAAIVIFAVMMLGSNYLLAGTQIFARDSIKNGRSKFKEFFGNCNRFFLGQFGVSMILWIPAWILMFLIVVLLSGAVKEAKLYPLTSVVLGVSSAILALLLMIFLALSCMSWAITAADGKNVFKNIWNSFLFCGRRFLGICFLLILMFVLAIVISLIVWISYAFVVQGLRRLGLGDYVIILREVTGCALYAYFFMFITSSLMSYYLNNRKEDEPRAF